MEAKMGEFRIDVSVFEWNVTRSPTCSSLPEKYWNDPVKHFKYV
jgi:hypothetical protein